MLRAHSVAKVRAAEEKLAAEVGWDELMQRAASGLAGVIADEVPADEAILMLVGPGNNGGDALFAAVSLCGAGRRVNLLVLDDERVHAAGLAAALEAGARRVESPDGHRWCVEGLFGIGGRSELSGRAQQWAEWIADEAPFVIAVDTPVVRSDITVAMGTYKPTLLVGPTADDAGDIVLVDIGLDPYLAEADVEAIEASDGAALAAVLFQDEVVHKYSRGVVGVLAGSTDYPGAAHLTVSGALGGPAGMVRFLGDPALADRVIDRHPEVVSAAGRVNAVVVGPGGCATPEAMQVALSSQVPIVCDAAALAVLPEALPEFTTLTPHAGELAAMLGTTSAEIEADPLASAHQASERWGVTVLLKGKRTVVATPGMPARVNLSGTPWLATAGSGDVLAGFIGSLLTARVHPHDAASLGAFLHGAAAVAANPGGPVTASAVAAAIPRVTADFLAGELGEVRDW